MAVPYDSVIVAVNAAQTRLNGRVDTLQPIGGQLVGNTMAFSQQVVNDAWRKLQGRLADRRYSGLEQQVLFGGVGPVSGTDPALQPNISFAGYFDGATLQSTPVLPQNLIRPYSLQERTTGSGALFTDMDVILWQLPLVPKMNWNRSWLWRNDTLFLPGALVSTDIAMLYAELLGDFVDGSSPWFQQQIPMMNCIDAFADYICREIEIARGDANAAAAFQMSGEANAELIINRDTAGPKRVYKASEMGKMRDPYTPGSAATNNAEQVER